VPRPHRRARRRTVHVRVECTHAAGLRRENATTLGSGGLFVPTPEPLEEGSNVALRFRLPGGDDLHEIRGRVVWTREDEPPGANAGGMGIEFTDPAAAQRLASELERIG